MVARLIWAGGSLWLLGVDHELHPISTDGGLYMVIDIANEYLAARYSHGYQWTRESDGSYSLPLDARCQDRV